MYIKSREQALEALAVILDLPDRAAQIIEVTMRIAVCLDADPRNFLADCQAALIQGGLEALRKRRREHLEALARRYAPPPPKAPAEPYVIEDSPEIGLPPAKAPEPPPEPPKPVEPFVIVDGEVKEKEAPAEPAAATPLTPDRLLDPLLEEVGTALDLLRMVDISLEVFKRVAKERPKWEFARYIFNHEEEIRKITVEGLRNRQDGAKIAEIETTLLDLLEKDKPWWGEWSDSLRETCKNAVSTMKRFQKAHPAANDHELLFHIIIMSEERAKELLDTVTKSPADSVAYVSEIRTRVDWIKSAEEQA